MKKERFQGGKDGLRRERSSKKSLSRSIRKHERVGGRKSSPGRSAESWFHSQVWPILRWERRLGDEEPAHKMQSKMKWV